MNVNLNVFLKILKPEKYKSIKNEKNKKNLFSFQLELA